MKVRKSTYIAIVAAVIFGLVATSCYDKRSSGIEYAPQMYHSIPYEPYTQKEGQYSPFQDKLNAQRAPEGTIAVGAEPSYAFMSFNDANGASEETRDSIGMLLKNPIPIADWDAEEGKELYLRFCGPCHGEKGKGDGPVANNDAINPKDYGSADMMKFSEGRLYHTIMVGKGVMGSYSSQLSFDERWKVVYYVQKLQNKLPTAAADTAATDAGGAASEEESVHEDAAEEHAPAGIMEGEPHPNTPDDGHN